MDRPTRQEQAQAILRLRAYRLASRILGRSARSVADYEAAFNIEMVDLISEIPTPAAMLSLGRNVVGPRDGLYVLDDGDSYRVYLQEKGETFAERVGADFDEARNAVIENLFRLGGVPFRPPG